MQRWKLWIALGLVGMLLMLVGAIFALNAYRGNKPDQIWVPITLSEDLLPEEHQAFAQKMNESLRNPELQKQVVMDTKLREKLKLASEAEAIKELNRRFYVELGSVEAAQGTVTTLNIGVRGKRHENEILHQLTTRITRDFFKINGIDPDTRKPIE
jgi:hypothetical protein